MFWAALILISLLGLTIWWTWNRDDSAHDRGNGVSLFDCFDFFDPL